MRLQLVILLALLACLSFLAQQDGYEEDEYSGDGDGGEYAGDEGEHVCAAGDAMCEAEALAPKGANADGAPPDAKECVDRHEACKGFAEGGECDINPGWMIINCPVSCNSCHMRDPKIRCAREALNMTLTPAYAPGDMKAMFEGIVDKFGSRYDITVLSTDPYVVTFDNFLSSAEAKALISTVKKWERSTDTGSANEFGEVGRILSSGRTSSNSWCNSECEAHPDVQTVIGESIFDFCFCFAPLHVPFPPPHHHHHHHHHHRLSPVDLSRSPRSQPKSRR